LQQVFINLTMNAVEAMIPITDREICRLRRDSLSIVPEGARRCPYHRSKWTFGGGRNRPADAASVPPGSYIATLPTWLACHGLFGTCSLANGGITDHDSGADLVDVSKHAQHLNTTNRQSFGGQISQPIIRSHHCSPVERHKGVYALMAAWATVFAPESGPGREQPDALPQDGFADSQERYCDG
jgi:hypothetical protein